MRNKLKMDGRKKNKVVVKTKRKTRYSKPQREFDERWISEVNSVREMVLGQIEAEKPKCPECKKSEFSTSFTTGKCVGTKQTHHCKNCGRSFVSDNDAYPQLYSKFTAAMIVLTQGDQAVGKAVKLLKNYSADLEDAPLTRFLKLRQSETSIMSANELRDAIVAQNADNDSQQPPAEMVNNA